jgi:hypothetical protein
MSDWSKTIEYINSFPNDEWVFTPMDVKDNVEKSTNTISLYVNYLHKAGFLKRANRGVYRRVQDIPSDLTLSKLKKFTYPEGATWEDRKRSVERYWKLKDIKNKIDDN